MRLVVWTVTGQRVATLADGPRGAGTHRIVWTGRDDAGRSVPSGTYFYSWDAGDVRQTRRMVLLR